MQLRHCIYVRGGKITRECNKSLRQEDKKIFFADRKITAHAERYDHKMSVAFISSKNNREIIHAASLKEKKYRDRGRVFVAEGIKLFDEAVSSEYADIERIYCTEDNYDRCVSVFPEGNICTVSREVFEKISTEKSPQGVICIIKYIDKLHNYTTIYNEGIWEDGVRPGIIILNEIRDPGNLGTIIRTASAFGIDRVILSSDCADIYNFRTVRAAMGTLFSQKITVVEDMPGTVRSLRECGYDIYSAMLDDGARRLDELQISMATAFIIGNEGHGIPAELAEASDGAVYIPMTGRAESLNAATAASVILWETFRQSMN